MTIGWRSRLPGVSLRELLAIVAFIAVACAAMVHPTELWVSLLSTLVLVLVALMLIVACVERGRTQAFALGFVAVLACYLLGVQNTRAPQPNRAPFGTDTSVDTRACLPTSQLLGNLWWQMRTPYYFDELKNPLEPFDGTIEEVVSSKSGFGPRPALKPPTTFGMPGGPTSYQVDIFPLLHITVTIGHLLFALAFGYLGGKLAVWIYRRRMAREQRSREPKPT